MPANNVSKLKLRVGEGSPACVRIVDFIFSMLMEGQSKDESNFGRGVPQKDCVIGKRGQSDERYRASMGFFVLFWVYSTLSSNGFMFHVLISHLRLLGCCRRRVLQKVVCTFEGREEKRTGSEKEEKRENRLLQDLTNRSVSDQGVLISQSQYRTTATVQIPHHRPDAEEFNFPRFTRDGVTRMRCDSLLPPVSSKSNGMVSTGNRANRDPAAAARYASSLSL